MLSISKSKDPADLLFANERIFMFLFRAEKSAVKAQDVASTSHSV